MRLTALLIDGDNINPNCIKELLDGCKYFDCNPILRCVYGDFSKPLPKKWLEISKEYSLTVRHESALKGKNSSDIALVIDAIDLLFTKPHITAFCIVTSDKDFIRLVDRIKLDGKFVIGAFEGKACPELQAVYDQWILIENQKDTARTKKPTPVKPTVPKVSTEKPNTASQGHLTAQKLAKSTQPKSQNNTTASQVNKVSNFAPPQTKHSSNQNNNASTTPNYSPDLVFSHTKKLLEQVPDKTMTFSALVNKLHDYLPGLKPQKSKNFEGAFFVFGPANGKRISLIRPNML
ncbi:MAG: NYN domain-containing protein [Christensenellaceae bacterium]|jgi:hypothetical protein|nr:NYN domain-containing protein [Christensenellaceae bacterium]